VAPVKYMKVIRFVGPNDWTVMVVAALWSDTNRLGEPCRLRIIGNQHRIGFSLIVFCSSGICVVGNVQAAMQQHRLRSLAGVIEHVPLAINTKA